MKILSSMIFGALSLSMLYSPWASATGRLDRRIIIEEEKVVGPFNPVDPNHSGMIGLGVYTQADADANTAEAIASFNDKFGIDFSTVPADPNTGIRVKPGVAIMLPYILGTDHGLLLTEDTKHPFRANTQKWFQIEVGTIMNFIGSGTITSGENTGATYKPNDNYFYGDLNLLEKDADWTKNNHREVIKATSYQLGITPTNQWGAPEYLITLDLVDENNKTGFGVSSTVKLRKPQATGTTHSNLTNVYSWYETEE